MNGKLQVKLKIGYTSPQTGELKPGAIVSLDQHTARLLLDLGHAEHVPAFKPRVVTPRKRYYQ